MSDQHEKPVLSTDQPLQLFEKQKRIFPKRVWGKFRKLKWLAMLITLSIYYLAPFLRYNRGPNAPDQAILIDLADSRAYFFFIEIWPQEVYFLTGILIVAAIGLFFLTSLFGRVWCGYLCFQTVWTDLFVWVERFVQGDRNARLKLAKSKWSLEKARKYLTTHALWLLISLGTGGAWVFYFNDAYVLLDQIFHLDVEPSVMGWIIALTLSTYLMAGFAREQVCTYMCPYARFQSAMFDQDSLVIGYDDRRGETRGKLKKGQDLTKRGHCVDCTACVQVCPMGIDIRDGLQMECIACGLCVDACNSVMDKLSLPHGLIRYDTDRGFREDRPNGSPPSVKPHYLRLRTLWYVGILVSVSVGILYGLLTRSPLDLHVIHDRNPLFVTLSDGTIRNGYDIKILNKTHHDKMYKVTFEGADGITTKVQGVGNYSLIALPVFADSVAHFRVFVMAPAQQNPRTPITVTLTDPFTGLTDHYETIFVSKKYDD
ncbi:cytochrome c oxidase accessory protein CcoG [Temperatibacter marinus]|uniref:Cytochrome c oxidase accessory protein CcoG n=1 Tax=Temperatibacter marinus TaxID=1456591 RepID=A0AA52EIZ6_9PROT|nr:cytochrome c oxidase accessory protein CcoG [Temperatibacter marinus]WND03402.1 cytochrome c oxidase accessory protein CcoG [Temperatibacter marinus]